MKNWGSPLALSSRKGVMNSFSRALPKKFPKPVANNPRVGGCVEWKG